VLDEFVERQAVHRPLDVPGFEAGELEDLVEQGAEPVDVAQDLLGVALLGCPVDEVVGDGGREQLHGGEGCAGVVGDADHERSARFVVGVALRLALNPQLPKGSMSSELTPLSRVVLALVGRGGAGPHDLVRMARGGQRLYYAGAASKI